MAVPWAMLAAAGIGMLQGRQQDKAQRKAMEMQALQNKYAPLFGQAPSSVAPMQDNTLKGLVAGGMTGYQQAMNYEMMKNAMQEASDDPKTSGFGTGSDLAMHLGPYSGQMITKPESGGMGTTATRKYNPWSTAHSYPNIQEMG